MDREKYNPKEEYHVNKMRYHTKLYNDTKNKIELLLDDPRADAKQVSALRKLAGQHRQAKDAHGRAFFAQASAAENVSPEAGGRAQKATDEANEITKQAEELTKTIETGKRGGRYYITPNGKKVYVGGSSGE